MATVLAGPPTECCLRTVQHTGQARGTVEEYAGVNTYVARPKSGDASKVILYFADLFGPLYVNAQLTMDYWASNGYTVLGIDYFEGDSVLHHLNEPGFDWRVWMAPRKERVPELLRAWIVDVRKRYEGSKFFCIGNCFGAPYVMEALAEDWVTAGAFAHPSFLDEGHFKNIKRPLLMLSAEEDFSFNLENRRKAVDVLIEHKKEYTMLFFGGVAHGFATRADPSVPKQRWAKEEAARAALSWLDHHAEYSSSSSMS